MIFFLLIWIRWFIVYVYALRYESYVKRYNIKSSVILPVVDEDPVLFKKVLSAINKQKPAQIIVVINGPRNKEIESICSEYSHVEWYWTRKPGKRNAIRYALKKVLHPITILVDSDTVWQKSTMAELVKPFRDDEIGGVTTKQFILESERDMISRVCDWLERVRANGTMKAMSSVGAVGCLPGRTIAFRTEILKKVIKEFMNEEFLGFHKEVSDDRSLTNLTLKLGYKTVMQETSLVGTDAPKTWQKFIRQQLRWSEGSQYNNVRMTPWMVKNSPLMLFIYWIDTVIPFMLWGIYLSWIIRHIAGVHVNGIDDAFVAFSGITATSLIVFGTLISFISRNIVNLWGRWKEVLYIPYYILVLSFVMAPIRIYGFAKLADDLGWGTRSNAYIGSANE